MTRILLFLERVPEKCKPKRVSQLNWYERLWEYIRFLRTKQSPVREAALRADIRAEDRKRALGVMSSPTLRD